MGQILGDSFDIVAAIRLLEQRIEGLEQQMEQSTEDELTRSTKPARAPKAKSETLEAPA